MTIAFPRITFQHYNALCITAILVLNAKDPIKDYWKRKFGGIGADRAWCKTNPINIHPNRPRKFGADSSSHANAIDSAPVVANIGGAAATIATS